MAEFNIFDVKIENEQAYIQEYEKFMTDYRLSEVSGEEVGRLIMRLCGFLGRYNVMAGERLKAYVRVKAEIINKKDEDTGKQLSAAKADVLADATPEAQAYAETKIHLSNLEAYINGLKALQKGVLNEYSNQ